MRSLSFTRSSAAPRTTVVARGERPEQPHQRQLVDHGRHLVRRDLGRRAGRRRARTTRSPQGSPATSRAGSSRDSDAHPPHDREQPGARRVEVDAREAHLGVAEQRRRHQQGAAEEKSPGTSHVGQRQPLDRAGHARPRRPRAAARRRPPRACARCGRATAPARAPRSSPSAKRPASSRQLFTWALATSRRCSTPRSGRPPVTTMRRRAAGRREDLRAHRRSGAAIARHRAPAQRVVAVEHHVGGRLARQDPGREAHERARVGAVDRRRRAQAAQAAPGDAHGVAEVARRPATPQASTAAERRPGVARSRAAARSPPPGRRSPPSRSARWVSDLSGGTWTEPRSRGTGATRTTATAQP